LQVEIQNVAKFRAMFETKFFNEYLFKLKGFRIEAHWESIKMFEKYAYVPLNYSN
jgi:hypothetical protein